jgi:small-conductance mechanosensitive channel
MGSNYDATDFVDGDFLEHKASPTPGSGLPQRAPSREELDSRVADAHQKLADKKRALEELERQKSALEETRRRQREFHTGREEMIHNLTRGLGLLEEAEFNARRDAEQMAKSLADLQDALQKIQAVPHESWTSDNFEIELTRALTILENARMEWNAARLKLPVLCGLEAESSDKASATAPSPAAAMASLGFRDLCRLGLAMTWPVAAVGLLALAAFVILLLRR